MLMSTDQKMKNNATVVWRTGSEIIREVIKKRHETVAFMLQELVDKIVACGVPTTHYIGKKNEILICTSLISELNIGIVIFS